MIQKDLIEALLADDDDDDDNDKQGGPDSLVLCSDGPETKYVVAYESTMLRIKVISNAQLEYANKWVSGIEDKH